jgi:hypothetical protein
MGLRGKLLFISAITITGILLISIATLIGIYHVRQSVLDVTENSTPRQLTNIEFTKELQEHGTLLSIAMSAATEAEISKRDKELGGTLENLKLIAAKMQPLQGSKNKDILQGPLVKSKPSHIKSSIPLGTHSI